MEANYIAISGTNYELGYKTGYWWAQYFINNRKLKAVKKFLRWCDYFDYFQNSWDLKRGTHASLLRNTMAWYPEIIEEVAGIEKGASDAFHRHKVKVNLSFLDMFCLMLGETDDGDYYNCSSAVLRTPTGYLLAHNDEYTDRYPVLLAKVALKSQEGTKRFISLSYPFQLLGSSAGANGILAYSGNSIGCKDQLAGLRATWTCRVPLSIFPRKLLEATAIDQVKGLFSQHHVTLPSHHYVVFKDKTYSVQIRPSIYPSSDPCEQVTIKPIEEKLHCHTNHFLKSDSLDEAWLFNKSGEAESRKRYNYLYNALNENAAFNENHVKRVFLEMGQYSRYSHQTAASYFFKIGQDQASFEGHFYFASGFKRRLTMSFKPPFEKG